MKVFGELIREHKERLALKKVTNNNVLEDKHIEKIMEMFDTKKYVDYIAKSVNFEDIAKNDYNLSVSSYVEVKDTREVIDILELNKEISETVENTDALRVDIDAIVSEIGTTDRH